MSPAFITALRSGLEGPEYNETCIRAIGFLVELERAKAIYSKDRQGRRFHACLTLVVSALLVGPDIKVLSSWTGLPLAFVSSVSRRMRSAALWVDHSKEIDEWRGTADDFMLMLFSHASVAVGHTGREMCSGGTIAYFDWHSRPRDNIGDSGLLEQRPVSTESSSKGCD